MLALVVGGAEVSFCDPPSSNSLSSGCSASCCSKFLVKKFYRNKLVKLIRLKRHSLDKPTYLNRDGILVN